MYLKQYVFQMEDIKRKDEAGKWWCCSVPFTFCCWVLKWATGAWMVSVVESFTFLTCHVLVVVHWLKSLTTSDGGSLGLCIDEEHSNNLIYV